MVGTRESPCRYTRCPKPMIFSLRASLARNHSRALAGSPISIMSCMTASLAPPCSRPLRAPIAPVTAL
ncbi:Uncharacterised protein [Mycobacterium tuberculosis]|nr:Uncharacterised protein [Mycobacterium tuberculosis]